MPDILLLILIGLSMTICIIAVINCNEDGALIAGGFGLFSLFVLGLWWGMFLRDRHHTLNIVEEYIVKSQKIDEIDCIILNTRSGLDIINLNEELKKGFDIDIPFRVTFYSRWCRGIYHTGTNRPAIKLIDNLITIPLTSGEQNDPSAGDATARKDSGQM